MTLHSEVRKLCIAIAHVTDCVDLAIDLANAAEGCGSLAGEPNPLDERADLLVAAVESDELDESDEVVRRLQTINRMLMQPEREAQVAKLRKANERGIISDEEMVEAIANI